MTTQTKNQIMEELQKDIEQIDSANFYHLEALTYVAPMYRSQLNYLAKYLEEEYG